MFSASVFRTGIILMILCVSGFTAQAQVGGGDHSIINVHDAFSTYQEVSQWLEDWKTPETGVVPDHTAGVWVGLRWSGRLMGSASDLQYALEDKQPERLLTGVVRKAMYRATEKARGSDGDATERQSRVDRLREIPAVLEMQFAHHLERVHGTTIEALATRIRSGLDGIVLRTEDGVAGLFPIEMTINDMSPAAAFEALRVDLQFTLDEFNARLADGRIRAWKFEVVHLAQETPTSPAMVLYRGSRLVPLDWVTQERVIEFADDLADHLIHRMWPGEEHLGIMGTYLADVDRFDPLTADTADQALAAFALAHYAGLRRVNSPKRAEIADKAARRILGDLAVRGLPSGSSDRPAGVSALIVIAVDAMSESGGVSAEVRDLRKRSMKEVEAVFQQANGKFDKNIPISEQAACALAMGTREAVDSVWRAVSPEQLPSVLPWLGWAEQRVAGMNGVIPSVAGFKNLRKRLWMMQVGAADSDSISPDEAGGLAFQPGQSPDWNTTRPLIFLASMLGDPRFTGDEDAEIMGEIVHLTQAVRFLRQLSEREEDRYRLPDPRRAMHGIRASLWTDRLPVGASASALIALTEFHRSLDSAQKRIVAHRKTVKNNGAKR